jgi:hypothetical protein
VSVAPHERDDWDQHWAEYAGSAWLVSTRAITITPFIPPTQVIEHFSKPKRRFYLSAIVGTVDDVQRRLGCPPFEKLVAETVPRQGWCRGTSAEGQDRNESA